MLLGENKNSDPVAHAWHERILNTLGSVKDQLENWPKIAPLLTDVRIAAISAEKAVQFKAMRSSIEERKPALIIAIGDAIESLKRMPDVLDEKQLAAYSELVNNLDITITRRFYGGSDKS